MVRAGEFQVVTWILAAVLITVGLWLAYKIGRIVLRIAAGLAFIAFITALIWYIFLR